MNILALQRYLQALLVFLYFFAAFGIEKIKEAFLSHYCA
jgi:hypothetical protein